MKQLTLKHEFALYWDATSRMLARQGAQVDINQEGLMHRMALVLRLGPGDGCILFDRLSHAAVTIVKITKKNITVSVDSFTINHQIDPAIIFLLPLLKRESLETAIYSLVELGATTIQLVMTDKVQRKWAGTAELERLQKIMIAAAEQSKHFAFAQLLEPVPLSQAIAQFSDRNVIRIFADPDGSPLMNVLEKVIQKPNGEVVLMVGPEGDLQPTEKELLHNHDFFFCRLTPTVIRACQAAGLMLGIFRSTFR